MCLNGKYLVFAAFICFCISCSKVDNSAKKLKKELVNSNSSKSDDFIWLEDPKSEKTNSWTKKENTRTTAAFATGKRYNQLKNIFLNEVFNEKEVIDVPAFFNSKYLSSFRKDRTRKNGILRLTTLDSFASKKPKWEELVDFDSFTKKESKDWKYGGMNCLYPEKKHCLIAFSHGGKDSEEFREFNSETKKFVTTDRFFIPEAKSWIIWVDKDTLLVASSFGEDTEKTKSGYAKRLKLWKRGTPFSSAEVIAEVPKDYVWIHAGWFVFNNQRHFIVVKGKDFFSKEYLYFNPVTRKLVDTKLPNKLQFFNMINQKEVLLLLKEKWQGFNPGDLLAYDIVGLSSKPRLIYGYNKNNIITDISMAKSKIFLTSMVHARSQVSEFIVKDGNLKITEPICGFNSGNTEVISSDDFNDQFFITHNSFLTPYSIYLVKHTDSKWTCKKLRQKKPIFKSDHLVAEQKFATSFDGVKIPYFVVRPKDIKLNSKNPTLIYAYGGFDISINPFYSSTMGKAWMEKGYVLIVANIRGGGEYGPMWHQQALKENRFVTYNDFFAVTEDLFKNKITNPKKVAIAGGSNGGLLVGVAITQKPGLYKAGISSVPLLDMLRYTKMPPGDSWVGEYGDPDENSKVRDFWLKYSPFHAVKKNVSYPGLLLMTSDKDDRVNPAHARKMRAKMQSLNLNNSWLYENKSGGHGAGDPEVYSHEAALKYNFLYQQVVDEQKDN